MTKEHDATVQGVENAWDFWLSQHDVSTPDCIVEAVGNAFDKWLTSHTDEIVEAIAKSCADRSIL